MKKTILIVEDNEVSMRLFDDLLRAHGYETVKSINGMDVVELAREHHPDLIILDIQLPVLSGIQLTIMLKAQNDLKNIAVIACTASAMDEKEVAFIDAGFDGYIAKPISVPLFLETVAKHIA